MNKRFSGSIDLSKLVSGVIKTKKGNKALIISIDENHLIVGEKGIYMNVNIILRDQPDEFKNDGFISHSVDSKTYKAANDEEKESFKKLPILGNIRNFDAVNDSVENAKEEEGTNDLPF